MVDGSRRRVIVSVTALYLAWTALAAPHAVPAGDSGEIVTAVWNLGIPHNPGYPLFVTVGKAMSLLPLGTIAMRTALLSGVCVAAAAAVFLGWVMPLIAGTAGSFAAGGLFLSVALVSERYRVLAREGEVYGAALLGITALAAFCVGGRGSSRFSVLFGCLAAAAVLTHYQAAIALLLIVVLFALGLAGGEGSPRLFPPAVLFPLLVLFTVTVLYLPLRSLANPLPDWGNPQTLGNLLFHVAGGEHLGTKLALTTVGKRLQVLTAEGLSPWGWWGMLTAIGAVIGVRRTQRWPLLAAIVIAEGVYALALNRVEPAITPFLLFTGLVAAGCAGVGAKVLGDLVGRRLRVPGLFFPLVPVVAVCLSPAFFARDLPGPADSYPQRRAERLLDAVPPASVAVVSGDITAFPLAYLAGTGAVRPDLVLLDRTNSVFRYPGWHPSKIDAEVRRFTEDAILGTGLPVSALGFTGAAEFGSLRSPVIGSVVSFADGGIIAVMHRLPPPLPLVGSPAGAMTRRTVADGVVLAVEEGEIPAGSVEPALLRLASWGRDDPYIINEAAYRLFVRGARDAALRLLADAVRRFPEVRALRSNLDSFSRISP